MDFGLAFSFPFQDEEWIKKILLTGVIILIPVVGQIAVMGWALTITRRIIRNDPEPLPDWSDFGGYLGLGFKAFVIVTVFVLPIIILTTPASLMTGFIEDDTMMTIFSVVTMLCGCISLIYGLAMGFILPAALGRLAATDELKSAFQLGAVFAIVKAQPGAYLMVMLGGLLASLISSLGTIACGIGVLATAAYAQAIYGHLWGQAYRLASPVSSEGSLEI